MAAAAAQRRSLLADATPGPAIIAHGAGNTLKLARAGIEGTADYLEVDLWVHQGRFEARHERRLVRQVPVLFEKWYLRRAPRAGLGLIELLADVTPSTGIFLDLKNGGPQAAGLVFEALRHTAWPGRMAASSQFWDGLRAVHRSIPSVDLYYSIDVPAKLDLFLSVMRRDSAPAGVSCRHTLLTPGVVRQLHDRGLLVVAWTVDDLDRAAELAAMGVDGITTHKPAEVRARVLAP